MGDADGTCSTRALACATGTAVSPVFVANAVRAHTTRADRRETFVRSELRATLPKLWATVAKHGFVRVADYPDGIVPCDLLRGGLGYLRRTRCVNFDEFI
jgi:hypothetical protein